MISRRTRVAAALYWDAHARDFCGTILYQHGILGDSYDLPRGFHQGILDTLRDYLLSAEEVELLGLFNYMGRNRRDLRSLIEPRYRHDQRWAELQRHLELDGYRLGDTGCVHLDPSLGEAGRLRDDLTAALQASDLPSAVDVLGALERSEAAYTREPYDFNACLSNARVALQTLVADIAERRLGACGGSFRSDVWGQTLAYLRTSGMVSRQEEEGIAGIFTFLSPGSHRLVGLDEQEMARLGRNLAQSILFFLLRTDEINPPCGELNEPTAHSP